MKFCKDCRHCTEPESEFSTCGHTKAVNGAALVDGRYVVLGRLEYQQVQCTTMRSSETKCGGEARYFSQRKGV